MPISAADVKRLREETDAPMMDCKAALEEAGGDFDRAKEILREKGKAAAAKRADRSTGAGRVAIAISEDRKSAGALVLESETDFVAKNEDFIALANELAQLILQTGATAEDEAIKAKTAEAVGKIRENIVAASVVNYSGEGVIGSYVHHDGTKGAMVAVKGTASNLAEVASKLAIQCVAFDVQVVTKEQLSQEVLAHELEVETKRALEEGKPENVAKNIAQGRVNKEFVKKAVLLEGEFYADNKKTVAQFVAEEAKAGGGTLEVVHLWKFGAGTPLIHA